MLRDFKVNAKPNIMGMLRILEQNAKQNTKEMLRIFSKIQSKNKANAKQNTKVVLRIFSEMQSKTQRKCEGVCRETQAKMQLDFNDFEQKESKMQRTC